MFKPGDYVYYYHTINKKTGEFVTYPAEVETVNHDCSVITIIANTPEGDKRFWTDKSTCEMQEP